jgi:hypothetical protein
MMRARRRHIVRDKAPAGDGVLATAFRLDRNGPVNAPAVKPSRNTTANAIARVPRAGCIRARVDMNIISSLGDSS